MKFSSDLNCDGKIIIEIGPRTTAYHIFFLDCQGERQKLIELLKRDFLHDVKLHQAKQGFSDRQGVIVL